ncbi:AAA family ATPase [Lysinibacillus xylanilyticus]|uniref:AAA family ATPase n=1 Tax=Lysinibacillus xylanilyticus TaxID=582475 RepID=UPI003D026B71
MALNAAHRGYIYQDLVTACYFVQSISHNYESIMVDKKLFKGDSLDDLTVYTGEKTIRSQFKYSQNRKLQLKDIKNEDGTISIVDIIKSHLEFKQTGTKEYRLCLAWDDPIDEEVLSILEKIECEPSLEVLKTNCYKLKLDKLWPEYSKPVWEEIVNLNIDRNNIQELCDSLIIELNWPKASLDLTIPGILEEYLINILEDKIGIGKYPNENRNAVDVAATLIRLATICRAESRTITPKEIINQLGIRTDFGKVSQRNIVDLKRYVARTSILDNFKAGINKAFTVLTGTPGSGKSWLLSMLYEDLKKDFLVARHYCYLEPGDEDVQRRVTTNAMFGNLISDLMGSKDKKRYSKSTLFSADEDELNHILEQASVDNEKIYLIVDGLDHISRVFNSTTDLSINEIDIVEKLMMLKIPHNVHIVLGTQPGKHLEPLSDLDNIQYYHMPDWEAEDIKNLFINYQLNEKIPALVSSEMQFYENIKSKTEGNPLYITFLIKRLLIDINSKIIDLEEFTNNIPLIQGDIRNYYEYLLQSTTDSGANLVGEILSAVDFGLTEIEIKEISGPFAARLISPALELLSPVLVNVSAQGGIRIYHESFKRFILERSQQKGESIQSLVLPIIDWLRNKDFFLDSKSYEFLLGMLRKGRLLEEIKSIVNSDFIIKSIAYCHPRKTIERNLLLASNAAKDLNDFKLQIRINELIKSLYVAFEEKLMDIRLYGKTFGMLYGFDLLAQRLILDGRITLDINSGLILCDLIDKQGKVAPWKEYCEAYRNIENQDNMEANIAFFKGVLKVEPWNEKHPILIDWFKNLSEKFNHSYIKGITGVLLELGLIDFIYELLNLELNEKLKSVLYFELAKYLFSVDRVKAKELIRSFSWKWNIEELLELLLNHNEISLLEDVTVENPEKIDLFLNGHISEAKNIYKWLISVRVHVAQKNIETINQELDRVSGNGWYRKWLVFIIEMAQIEFTEFKSDSDRETEVLNTFKSLLNISSPFEGKPRACDLHSIEPYIYNSFKKGLKYVCSAKGWKEVLQTLEEISMKTTTYLMGSAGGPLPSLSLIKLLDSLTHIDNAKAAIVEAMERLTHKASKSGEYFEIQAEHEMYYSVIMNNAGNKEVAHSSWNRVCRYLCSYGFHKDITIYELLYSVKYFIGIDDEWIKQELFNLLPLLNNVLNHTNQKEVRYVHNDWFKYLLLLDFNLATKILSQSLKSDGGEIDWKLEDALEEVVIQSYDLIPKDVYIVSALSSSIPFRYDLIKKMIDAIKSIKQIDIEKANTLYIIIKARIYENDLEEKVLNLLNEFEMEGAYFTTDKEEIEEEIINNEIVECYLSDASFIDLSLYIKNLTPSQLCNDKVINSLGYKMIEYSTTGNSEDINKIIDLLARKLKLYNKELSYIFNSLMIGLERYNINESAVYLSILQYTRVYDKGWSYFGGKEMIPIIEQNYRKYPEYIDNILQNELELNANSEIPSFGVTSNLIHLFARLNIDLAKDLWTEAFDVISLRLKTERNFSGPFIDCKDIVVKTNSIESIIELIMSRITHPELKRRTWALWGIQYSYFNYENEFLNALDEFIKTDIYESTFDVILSLLLEREVPEKVLTNDWIRALLTSDYFSINQLAHFILGVQPGNLDSNLVDNLSIEIDFDESILSLDRNQAAINIEPYLPNIIEQTCNIFENIFESNEVYVEKMQSLYRAFSSTRERILPKVHYWGIENEIYKQVLNREVLKFGNVNPLILSHMVSDLRIPISMKYSKVRYPEDVDIDLENHIPKNSNIEGFEDWVTIASIQNEVILEEGYFANMQSIKKVYSGLVSIDFADISSIKLPFKKVEDIDWWYIDEAFEHDLPKPPVIYLSSYGTVYNDFGEHRLLKLEDSIINALNLKAADFPSAFDLLDQNNEVAVAYRNWEYDLIGTDLSEETFRLSGFELVMRSDIFDELLKKYNGNVYRVSKKYIH